MQEQVREFQAAAGLPNRSIPTLVAPWALHRRAQLIKEELAELQMANAGDDAHEPDLLQAAKELTDLLYVVLGTFVEMGLDSEKLLSLVHASNMTKAPFTRDVNGKIEKGPNYQAPDLREAVYGRETASPA